MSNISSININNTNYNLKDKNALPITGGTMTGVLKMGGNQSFQLIDNRITIGTPPTDANIWSNGIIMKDSANKSIGQIRQYYLTNGTVGQEFRVMRTVLNENLDNFLRLQINSSGTKTVGISDPVIWRNALGASSGVWSIDQGGTGNTTGLAASATKLATARGLWVRLNLDYDADNLVTFDGTANKGIPVYSTLNINHGGTGATTASNALDNLGGVAKSGDTMTGNLIISDASLQIKKPNADISTSSISANQYAVLGGTDKNNRYMGYVQTVNYTNGMTAIQVAARKYINNANVDNSLNLQVDASGNRTIAISDSKIWRNALGASNGIWPTSVGGTGGAPSEWKTITNDTFDGTIYYRRMGAFCEVYGNNLKLTTAIAASSTAGVVLGNISDTNCRPVKEQYYAASSTYEGIGTIRILTNGNIQFFKERGSIAWDTSKTFCFSVFYFCD